MSRNTRADEMQCEYLDASVVKLERTGFDRIPHKIALETKCNDDQCERTQESANIQ